MIRLVTPEQFLAAAAQSDKTVTIVPIPYPCPPLLPHVIAERDGQACAVPGIAFHYSLPGDDAGTATQCREVIPLGADLTLDASASLLAKLRAAGTSHRVQFVRDIA